RTKPAPHLIFIVFGGFGNRNVNRAEKCSQPLQFLPAFGAGGNVALELLYFRRPDITVIQQYKFIFAQMIHCKDPIISEPTAIRIFRTARKMYCLAAASLMCSAWPMSRIDELSK